MVEVNCTSKHSSLLQYGNNYNRKSFIVQAPVATAINHSTPVINIEMK
jgi:hypothetical protein